MSTPPTTPSPSDILRDPNFQGMPPEERVKALSAIDQNFAKLPQGEQMRVIGMPGGPPPNASTPGYTTGTISAVPEFPSKKWFKEKTANLLEYAPLVGGALGGIAGSPGVGTAVLGAGAGGVLGEDVKQLGRQALGFKVPETAGETAGDIATSGASQALGELGGQGLSKAAKAAATSPAVQRWMARPLNRMLRPEMSAFDYGTNPGASLLKQGPPMFTGKYGMRDFIADRISNLTPARDAIASGMANKGLTVDAETPIKNVVGEAMKNPTKYEETTLVNKLAGIEEKLTTQAGEGHIAGPGGKLEPVRLPRGYTKMPVDQAIKFRQYLDDVIGDFEPESTDRVKGTLQAIRGQVNQAIHGAAPEIKEVDSQLSGLIEAKRAMNRRIAHLESGTRETSAGAGAIGKISDKLHIPGTRTVPGAVFVARARQMLGLPGSTKAGQAALRQVPRVPLIPVPDDETVQQQGDH